MKQAKKFLNFAFTVKIVNSVSLLALTQSQNKMPSHHKVTCLCCLQLHMKEEALVNFKSELAVMELEIQVNIHFSYFFFSFYIYALFLVLILWIVNATLLKENVDTFHQCHE